MTGSVVAGCLLGAVCALPAARLAELTMNEPLSRPVRLRLALIGAAGVYGAVAAAQQGLPTTALAVPALVPAMAAAAVDVHERRLPDRLTAAVAVVVALEVIVLLGLDSAAGGRGAGAFGMVGVAAVLTKAVNTDAVGWGDVKLAPGLAALLAVHGWPTLYAGVLAWSILIALTAVLAVAYSSSTGIIAYGPALVAGTAGALAVIG